MFRKTLVFAILLLLLTAAACRLVDDLVGEYKPAIMVQDSIYWLCPAGNVDDIPSGCEVVGQIERISPSTQPPAENYEAIGFSEDFLGSDIYRSEDGTVIYVFNPELEEYVPLELCTD